MKVDLEQIYVASSGAEAPHGLLSRTHQPREAAVLQVPCVSGSGVPSGAERLFGVTLALTPSVVQ